MSGPLDRPPGVQGPLAGAGDVDELPAARGDLTDRVCHVLGLDLHVAEGVIGQRHRADIEPEAFERPGS